MRVRISSSTWVSSPAGPGRGVGRGVDTWLARLGLAGRAEDRLDALSHGNQQRVQLIAALVNDPELLVLDERFSGLDPIAIGNMSADCRLRPGADLDQPLRGRLARLLRGSSGRCTVKPRASGGAVCDPGS
jgi:hypothetical protein